MKMKNAHTSVTDRIPKPLGPKPSSIFNDKSWFLSCHNKIQKNINNNQRLYRHAESKIKPSINNWLCGDKN